MAGGAATDPATKSKPLEPVITPRMILLGAVGLGLFLAEYVEMRVLAVPQHIAISGFDMTALAIGNLPGVVLSILGILSVLLTLMVVFVLLLVVPAWSTWLVFGAVLSLLTLPVVGLGMGANQSTLRLVGLIVSVPRIGSPEIRNLVRTRRQINHDQLSGIVADLWAPMFRFVPVLVHWSAWAGKRPVAIVSTIIHAPGGYMKKMALYLCLIGVLVLSNYALARNYQGRIAVMQQEEDEDNGATCAIPFTLSKVPEVIRDAERTALDCYASYAAWIQPIRKRWLVLNARHPVNVSVVAQRNLTSRKPAPDQTVSMPVIYIGDYGEWAMVQPIGDTNTKGSPEPGLIRRASIVEIASSAAQVEPRGSADDPMAELRRDVATLEGQVAALGSMIAAQRLSAPVSLTAILVSADRVTETPEVRTRVDRRLNRIGLRYDIRQAILDQLDGAGDLADIAACFHGPDIKEDRFAFEPGRRTSDDFAAGAPALATRIARLADTAPRPLLVFVQGGASPTGTRRYNLDLSERRAEWMSRTLHAALAAHELSPDAVRIIDFGAGEQLNLRAPLPQTPESRIVLCETGVAPDIIDNAESVVENLDRGHESK